MWRVKKDVPNKCIFQKQKNSSILGKVDLKTKKLERDRKGDYVMIEGSTQQELTLLNECAPNTRANLVLNIVKQLLMI